MNSTRQKLIYSAVAIIFLSSSIAYQQENSFLSRFFGSLPEWVRRYIPSENTKLMFKENDLFWKDFCENKKLDNLYRDAESFVQNNPLNFYGKIADAYKQMAIYSYGYVLNRQDEDGMTLLGKLFSIECYKDDFRFRNIIGKILRDLGGEYISYSKKDREKVQELCDYIYQQIDKQVKNFDYTVLTISDFNPDNLPYVFYNPGSRETSMGLIEANHDFFRYFYGMISLDPTYIDKEIIDHRKNTKIWYGIDSFIRYPEIGKPFFYSLEDLAKYTKATKDYSYYNRLYEGVKFIKRYRELLDKIKMMIEKE